MPNAILTKEELVAVAREYEETDASWRELAKKYGYSHTALQRAVAGATGRKGRTAAGKKKSAQGAGRPKKYSDEAFLEAKALRGQGLTWREIVKRTGIPLQTLKRRVGRLEEGATDFTRVGHGIYQGRYVHPDGTVELKTLTGSEGAAREKYEAWIGGLQPKVAGCPDDGPLLEEVYAGGERGGLALQRKKGLYLGHVRLVQASGRIAEADWPTDGFRLEQFFLWAAQNRADSLEEALGDRDPALDAAVSVVKAGGSRGLAARVGGRSKTAVDKAIKKWRWKMNEFGIIEGCRHLGYLFEIMDDLDGAVAFLPDGQRRYTFFQGLDEDEEVEEWTRWDTAQQEEFAEEGLTADVTSEDGRDGDREEDEEETVMEESGRAAEAALEDALRPDRFDFSADELAQVAALYECGTTWNEIGRITGLRQREISKALKKAGVKPNRRGEATAAAEATPNEPAAPAPEMAPTMASADAESEGISSPWLVLRKDGGGEPVLFRSEEEARRYADGTSRLLGLELLCRKAAVWGEEG